MEDLPLQRQLVKQVSAMSNEKPVRGRRSLTSTVCGTRREPGLSAPDQIRHQGGVPVGCPLPISKRRRNRNARQRGLCFRGQTGRVDPSFYISFVQKHEIPDSSVWFERSGQRKAGRSDRHIRTKNRSEQTTEQKQQ